MVDKFSRHGLGLDSPAAEHYSVTPNDTTELDPKPRALYVGVEGDVVITDQNDVDATYKAVFGLLPVRPKKVKATGTTATNIVALL